MSGMLSAILLDVLLIETGPHQILMSFWSWTAVIMQHWCKGWVL